TLEGRCSLVDMLSIMIEDGIRAGDQTERERGGEGEPGEEEHLKCGHTEASGGDEPSDQRVLHSGVCNQYPKIADCYRQIPKRHDRTFHRERCLAVGEFEPSGG